MRTVVDQVDLDRGRQLRLEARQQLAHVVDHLDGVGVRLALHQQHDGALAVVGAVGLGRLVAVLDRGDVLQAHRLAVAGGDDQVGEVGRLHHLRRALDGQGLLRTVEDTERRVRVGRAQRGRQLVHRQVTRVHQVGLGAHAHGETSCRR
jgi:hypothetical protein